MVSHPEIRVGAKIDKIVGFHDATNTTHTTLYTRFRDAWAPHTQTQRHGELAMMNTPL
jgi:hypothetical protein